jgi:DNA-binding transcriptional LysR family regulator
MDRLEAMSLLLSVVEAGSLSATSRNLGVPLPTVSRKISDLEAHLKTRLLTRSTRKLALTDSGAAYVAAARRILDEVSEAERAASGEHAAPRGDLVVTAPVVFGRLHVLPVIAEFLTRWPEINVRLVLADRNLDLIDDHVDIAVRIGALADSALVSTRVGAVRSVVCGSPTYFAAYCVPERPEDLSALAAVTFDLFSPVAALDLPRSKVEARTPRAGALAPHRQHCGSGNRWSGRRSRRHARPVLSGRASGLGRSNSDCPCRVRASAGAGQPHLSLSGIDAAQSAHGSGFRRASIAGAARVEHGGLRHHEAQLSVEGAVIARSEATKQSRRRKRLTFPWIASLALAMTKLVRDDATIRLGAFAVRYHPSVNHIHLQSTRQSRLARNLRPRPRQALPPEPLQRRAVELDRAP